MQFAQSLGEELLSGWFLAFLAGASIAVMVPGGLRARRNSPYSAAQMFKKRMALMAPRSRSGRYVVVPDLKTVPPRARRQRPVSTRRRMRVLAVLGAAAVGSAVWAILTGGAVLPIHALFDLVLIGYLVLITRADRRARERRKKVRHMPRQYGEPPLLNVAEAGMRR